jgi:hypothetical protein
MGMLGVLIASKLCLSEQRAARCISVATGVHLERGQGAPARRGITAPNAHAWKCQAHARVETYVAKGRSHRGVCLICGKEFKRHPARGQRSGSAPRSKSNTGTELTDEGPQGGHFHWMPTWYLAVCVCGGEGGSSCVVTGVGIGNGILFQ